MRFDKPYKKAVICTGVSCLCVTKNRVDMLKRAIECFSKQTYKLRELIIMVPADDETTLKYMETVVQDNIFWHIDDPKLTLGERRNLSLENAHYDHVMIWDDDDWYSNYRIQVAVLDLLVQNTSVVFADRMIIYNNFAGTFSISTNRALREGTMLAQKSLIPKYPPMPRGSDSAMISELLKVTKPYLSDRLNEHYIRVYHDKNIWDGHHFNNLMNIHGMPHIPEFQNEFLVALTSTLTPT